MLQVMDIDFSYRKTKILSKISFELDYGQSVCLLGKNGVGKSTLFKCLLNIVQPTSGVIKINGQALQRYSRSELSKLVSYIPQKQKGHIGFTVFEMVLMGTTSRLKHFRQPGKAEYDLVEAALAELNIIHLKQKLFSELSGGEQQLVIIARSVAQQSKIIIMDEPCANLDYGNQIVVLEMIRALSEKGYLIIQATHDPNHVLQYGDQVLILREGRLLIQGTPNEVLTSQRLEEIYQVPVVIRELGSDRQRVCLPQKSENN
ncbi:ABC transporter ATP-binding protein [Enterococcus wangshanyuanii]|uniref:ABC transporter n=1 Tax=Enterococcus wangshanyuanii TaxID=2005703 RepID=A0ABQ1NKJ7_9ENTE|nr:ABC transporter ATP-binding protein [Enterococcus wangshanyuanii]GGC78791.1 ABC transporter [Enterococcus wangshanyuanii]